MLLKNFRELSQGVSALHSVRKEEFQRSERGVVEFWGQRARQEVPDIEFRELGER